MSHNSTDLRVRRTQKLIREALIALIEERSFDVLTVGEIAARAMVSRAAFYRYYQDKYDLVEKIFEEMLTAVMRDIEPLRHEAISRVDAESSWDDLFGRVAESQSTPSVWAHWFEHFAEHARLYSALLGRRGSASFAARIRMTIADMLRVRLQSLAVSLHSEQITEKKVFVNGFVPALIAAQIMDAVTWWLEQGRPFTPEQIGTYCYGLLCATLREAGTWE